MSKQKKSYLFGTVQNGKIQHEDVPKLCHMLKGLEGQQIRILIEKKPKQRRYRSNEQNGYYWAEPLAVLADHTGHTPDEMHDTMKAMFLKVTENVKGFEFEIIKSTTSLNTLEFEEYLTNIRMWASMNLGIYIRKPNEVGYEFEL